MKFLYRCLTYCYVLPLSIAILIARLFGDRTQIERLGLGLPETSTDGGFLWLVASSVGEVNIAAKLIARLKSITEQPMLLTVTTRTGRRHAMRSGCGADVIAHHPFDIPTCARRFLDKFRPRKIILIETELWPVLMDEAFGRGVRILQISGRLSEKSLRRYRPFAPLFQPLLQQCEALMMQSDEDAARLREIAGTDARIRVVGSAKSEYVPPPAADLQRIDKYLHAWQGMKIVVCGSTRPGEETILLDAFSKLRPSYPDVRLVLAPRHLERLDEVDGIIKQSGWSTCRRSRSTLDAGAQVLLLDTIGELNLFYHLCDIAFVGGTLVPLGGHSLLEPALAGRPVLYGPYFGNQKSGHEALTRHGMGFEVSDADQISKRIAAILDDKQAGEETYSRRADALRQESASIIDRYVAAIVE